MKSLKQYIQEVINTELYSPKLIVIIDNSCKIATFWIDDKDFIIPESYANREVKEDTLGTLQIKTCYGVKNNISCRYVEVV